MTASHRALRTCAQSGTTSRMGKSCDSGSAAEDSVQSVFRLLRRQFKRNAAGGQGSFQLGGRGTLGY